MCWNQIFFRLKNAKNCQRKKKTWVGIVGEMQNTWMKYCALEFAAHLCASIISFWVWSMWFTQLPDKAIQEILWLHVLGQASSFWQDLPFPWLSRKPKHLSLLLASTQTTFQLVTLLRHKYTPLHDQHPFSFTLFSFMNFSLVDFLLTRLQVLQSERKSLSAWTTVFKCHNKVEGRF
jgi:hypothetical protein